MMRAFTVILALAAALATSCVKRGRETVVPRPLIDAEQLAVSLTVDLDAEERAYLYAIGDRVVADQFGEAGPTAAAVASQRARIDSLRRELAKVDAALDRDIAAEYARYRRDDTSDGPAFRRVTAVAAFHWTVLLRRQAARPLHTLVPGLDRDEACRGDLLKDQLIWRYLSIVVAPNSEASRGADAVAALAAVQRQLNCLGGRQIYFVDAFLIAALDELEQSLATAGMHNVRPAVVDAASNLMLLVYDAVKAKGERTASYRWWKRNDALVRAGFVNRSAAASWHGLWLYDRRNGRFIGFDPTCEREAGCVNAPRFVTSVIHPMTLGNGDCAFAEMIERGLGPDGYACNGSVCEGAPGSTASASPAAPSSLTPELKRCPNGTSSPFGATCSDVANSCDDTRDDSGGTGLCGESGRLTPLARCLTSISQNASRRVMKCMAESAGACDAPSARLTKPLRDDVFNGVLIGRSCRVSSGGSDLDRALSERKAEALRLWDDQQFKEKAFNAFKQELGDVEVEQFEYAWQAARGSIEGATLDPTLTEGAAYTDSSTNQITLNKDEFGKREASHNGQRNAASLAHEGVHVVGNHFGTKAEQDHKVVEKVGLPSKADPKKMCSPDDMGCTDSCTAGSEQLDALLACNQTERQPTRPTVVDPSPIDERRGPLSQCIAGLRDPLRYGQRTCMTVDCPDGKLCDAATGRCVARQRAAVPGGAVRVCGVIKCADGGPPLFDGERCRCNGTEGPGELPGTLGPPPPGPLQ